MTMRAWRGVVAGVLTGSAPVAPDDAAGQAPAAVGEWRSYRSDLASTKYSPLDQIDASNFGALEAAWQWESVDGYLSMTMPDGSEWWGPSEEIFAALSDADSTRWRDGTPPVIEVGARPAVRRAKLNGRQYIAVTGGGASVPSLVALALPE